MGKVQSCQGEGGSTAQLPQVVASLANFLPVSSFCRKNRVDEEQIRALRLYLSASLGIQKTSTCSRLGGWGGIYIVFVFMSLFSGRGGTFPSMSPCNAAAATDDDEIISCSAVTLDEDTSASFGVPFRGLIVHWWDIYMSIDCSLVGYYVNTTHDFPFLLYFFSFCLSMAHWDIRF